MKVYLACINTDSGYGADSVEAVFDSREKAEFYLKEGDFAEWYPSVKEEEVL